MSYIYDKKKEQHGNDLNPVADDAGVAVENLATVQEPEPEGKPPTEPVITEMNDDSMVYDDTAQGKKRPHSSTDSDSEWKVVSRRQRLRPVPNIENARNRDKKTENIQSEKPISKDPPSGAGAS